MPQPYHGLAAVFLDKDGTVVEDVPYNVRPELVSLTEGAAEALRLLRQHDYRLYIVSNQSGVARGMFDEGAVRTVESRLREMLCEHGIALDGFDFCPHYPRGSVPRYAVHCVCRKPAPGMILRTARVHGIDLGISWMVGDILDDIEAGKAAGCRTVLIDNGHETEWRLSPQREPDFTAATLLEAAWLILGCNQADQDMSRPTRGCGSASPRDLRFTCIRSLPP